MPDIRPRVLRNVILALLAITFVLFLHRAVPFLMLPTLGQAVWTTGFSQSLANGPMFNFYVRDFGIPKPAAIAFGLAGAWPASLLIRMGLHPADAYAGMAASWLTLAMLSAYQLVRRFGATLPVSLLGALTWMSMPIIWAHAGYSMLSLGFALLSFYFMAAVRLLLMEPKSTRIAPTAIAFYFAAAIVAVFMDGYTFMMFASGSSILLLYFLIMRPEVRHILVKVVVPVHVASFGLAYFLFSTYIGASSYETHHIDLFRGWGLDISFVVIPTERSLWLPDLLGLSVTRSNQLYFGDGSVWLTTFALPVLLLGLVAWWRVRRNTKISAGVLLVAVFGFYMALGPSLKINSTKPESLQISHPGQQSALMPSEYAVMPTGSAWISEKLPGFNVMRASYRWSALGIFALWLLIVMQLSCNNENTKKIWLLSLFTVMIFNLPDLQKNWQHGIDNRSMFYQIDRELVAELDHHIRSGDTVVFIPWGNDFFANYLAPTVGFRTFNIGGDKNSAAAQSGWPREMLAVGGEINTDKAFAAVKMLSEGTADVIVLPYFDMLWSAHRWPCVDQSTAGLSEEQEEGVQGIPGSICLSERKTELEHIVLRLRDTPYAEVVESPLFAAVRLRAEFSGEANRSALFNSIFEGIRYPIELGGDFKESPYVLREGWHAPEALHVWSQSAASLMLPIPEECGSNKCKAILQFAVFGASPQRPVSVLFNSVEHGRQWSEKLVATISDSIHVGVPLVRGKNSAAEVFIFVPEATSPLAISESLDDRVLGIALQRIELINR